MAVRAAAAAAVVAATMLTTAAVGGRARAAAAPRVARKPSLHLPLLPVIVVVLIDLLVLNGPREDLPRAGWGV